MRRYFERLWAAIKGEPPASEWDRDMWGPLYRRMEEKLSKIESASLPPVPTTEETNEDMRRRCMSIRATVRDGDR
jgi:hypothetical protein